MSFAMARGLIAHLTALALIFNGVELLKMWDEARVIWSFDNLRTEFDEAFFGLPQAWISAFTSDDSLKWFAWSEIAIGGVAFVHPGALAFLILLLVHFLACVRMRGSINGGSDAMTVSVLVGLVLAYLFHKESFARFGLYYIVINLLLSYAKAGYAKIRSGEWKDGTVLPQFMEQSFFPDIRAAAPRLGERAKQVAMAVMAIEVAVVLSPLLGGLVWLPFLVMVVFHFAIYWAFGLNRFFWIWIAAWPSVFYVAEALRG